LPPAQKNAPKAPLIIEPGPGQIYLQVSAVEKEEALRYAEQLRGQSLDAVVAQVPGGNRFRVLIGPFADQSALLHGQEQARRSGLHTILRKY
jgi:cell division septation protein DedD